jgi:non-specific serine/threonine protein kinase
LIDSKKGLSDELLTGGDEVTLTEMTNDEIMRMVSLDLNAAMTE